MQLEKKNLSSNFSCRCCNSHSTLVAIHKKNFPLYIWPLPKSEITRLMDINVHLCINCGYIQLQNINNEVISEIYRDKAFNIENEIQNINRYEALTFNDQSKFSNTKVLEVGGG